MILDTEGIRAPEFAGQVHSDARDNKMATMSIIPSDASIMMTVGDDDSAVKDILPIVLRIEGLNALITSGRKLSLPILVSTLFKSL